MLRRVSVLALATIAGCASATVNEGDVDGGRIDAAGGLDAPPPVDAPPLPIDAPPIQTITLAQGPTTITASSSRTPCASPSGTSRSPCSSSRWSTCVPG